VREHEFRSVAKNTYQSQEISGVYRVLSQRAQQRKHSVSDHIRDRTDRFSFWADVEEYKRITDRIEMEAAAIDIYDRYFPVEAPDAVNLPGDIVS
jgi:hypothetical protein